MKKNIYFLLFVSIAFLLSACGTAAYKADLKNLNMSSSEARAKLKKVIIPNILRQQEKRFRQYKDKEVTAIDINFSRIKFSYRNLQTRTYTLDSIDPVFESLKNTNDPWYLMLNKEDTSTFSDGYRGPLVSANDSDKNIRNQFIDALTVIRNSAVERKENASKDANEFAEVVAKYQKEKTNTVLSEDLRRLKVQAESALKEKNFEEAAELYNQALKIAPWWPEGHFNMGLVLAEIEDYKLAAEEMKKYLQLVPNATDKQKVQDKIYAWERKAND